MSDTKNSATEKTVASKAQLPLQPTQEDTVVSYPPLLTVCSSPHIKNPDNLQRKERLYVLYLETERRRRLGVPGRLLAEL